MALNFGRYQLLRKIASGGMGQVFLARAANAQGFEKLLVLKRVLPHLAEDDSFLQMFFEEARIAARLNHPNLVQIFELGEESGSAFLAMEYVPGEDLRRLDKNCRKQGKPLPLGLACRIIADAAAGLHHAHNSTDAKGQPLKLVHRDVSPQNVLVGFSGAVKLIDFGVAKAANSAQLTQSGVVKGKVPYFSPEQATGKPIDHRSDQFALGIVFWELLTGARLFRADDDFQTLDRVRNCVVPAPSTLVEIPDELEKIVLRALARSPDARFKDCGAMRLAIEEFTIKNALPASTAHLAEFMHELYAERIAAEANIEAMDQLAPEGDLDALPTPRSGSLPAARRPGPSVAPPEEPGNRTISARPPPPKRPMWPFVAVVGLVLALGGTGFLAFNRKAEPKPPPAPSPAATAPVQVAPAPAVTAPPPAPVPAPVPSKPAPTVVTLISTPKARVQEGTTVLGDTPLQISVEQGAKRELSLSLAGYVTQKIELTADSAMKEVELERAHSRVNHSPGIKSAR